MARSEPCRRLPVLVVEDEPVLRLDALDMVERAGFEAIEALGATDAIRILEKRLDIRIVYMDLDMPRGVQGIEIAAAIRDRWPPIKIILTAASLTERDMALPERAEFFASRSSRTTWSMRCDGSRRPFADSPTPISGPIGAGHIVVSAMNEAASA